MVASVSEHRLQMRILFVLSLLGALVALAFSQSAGLFNPPSIIAAGAQLPEEVAALTPGSPRNGGVGSFSPGTRTRQPFVGNRAVGPRTPGVQQSDALEDGLGGPVELAEATSTVPPSIAADLGTPPAGAGLGGSSPGGIDFGPGGGLPGGGLGGTPGASTDNPPTTPTDPGTPTTAVPEPATWLIMIVGIAIIGGALRRRRPVSASIAFAHA